MPRLVVITDGSVSLDGVAGLPTHWRIVVLPDADAVVGRVGAETSLALIAVRPEERGGAARSLGRHLPSVPCALLADDARDGLPTVPTRMRGASLAHALERARQEIPSADTSPKPAAPAGGALLRRMRARMVEGIARAGDVLTHAEEQQEGVPERIDEALSALHRVRALIDDMPALGTVDEIARALVEEVAEVLGADTVVVWEKRDGVMEVRASRGLTAAEQRMTLGPEHPVVADLDRNVNGVLLAPLDEARALVAGIAGARGAAFLAASLDVDGDASGFVSATGSREYDARDLRRLEALAEEAGRGFSLASILRELGLDAGDRQELLAAASGVRAADAASGRPSEGHTGGHRG